MTIEIDLTSIRRGERKRIIEEIEAIELPDIAFAELNISKLEAQPYRNILEASKTLIIKKLKSK